MRTGEFVFCRKYCQHGGVCVLSEDHNGLHSTKSPFNDFKYCEWTDEECISKEEADLLIMAISPLSDEITQWIIDRS